MAEFKRLCQAVLSNDWDTIASLSYLLVSTSIRTIDVIEDVLDRRDIPMTRLVCGRCRGISPYAAYSMGFAMKRENFKMAVILHKLGHIVWAYDTCSLMRRSTNLRFIDWAMKNCEPPLGKEFIDWKEQLENFKMDIEPRILQHMVYRSFIQRYLDEETIDLMKNVLQKGFDDLPKELIHEICLYLFLCSPPPHNK